MSALLKDDAYQLMEKVVLGGDLRYLSSAERMRYYSDVCTSLGLNPLTRPFNYLYLPKGKVVLYATKDCTEQLRKINGISISIVAREFKGDLYIVTSRAQDKTGRFDESIGVVSLGDASGEDKANLLMRAETKAKRRVTLSISGLSVVDESEVDSIRDAKIVNPELMELENIPKKIEIEDIAKKEEIYLELISLISQHDISSDTVNKWMQWGKVEDLSHLENEKMLKIIREVKRKYSEGSQQADESQQGEGAL